MKKLLSLFTAMILLMCAGCQGVSTAPTANTAINTTVFKGYQISYEFELISNASVGNDWVKSIDADGSTLPNGKIFSADTQSPLYLSMTIMEDDKYPDVGRGSMSLSLEDGAVSSTQITVRENRGRFSGNTALWEVTAFCQAVYE